MCVTLQWDTSALVLSMQYDLGELAHYAYVSDQAFDPMEVAKCKKRTNPFCVVHLNARVCQEGVIP